MNRTILATGLIFAAFTTQAMEWVSPANCQPNWNPNPPEELVEGYRVYISGTDPVTNIIYDVGNVTSTSCATVGLTAQGVYEMYVTAYNTVGESGPSNIVPFGLVVYAPGSPSGAKASP